MAVLLPMPCGPLEDRQWSALHARLVDAGDGLDQPLAADLAQVRPRGRARRLGAEVGREPAVEPGRPVPPEPVEVGPDRVVRVLGGDGLHRGGAGGRPHRHAAVLAPDRRARCRRCRSRAASPRTAATAGPAHSTRLAELVEAEPAGELGRVAERDARRWPRTRAGPSSPCEQLGPPVRPALLRPRRSAGAARRRCGRRRASRETSPFSGRPGELEHLHARGLAPQAGGHLAGVLAAGLVVVGQDDHALAGQRLGVSRPPLAGALRVGGRDEARATRSRSASFSPSATSTSAAAGSSGRR